MEQFLETNDLRANLPNIELTKKKVIKDANTMLTLFHNIVNVDIAEPNYIELRLLLKKEILRLDSSKLLLLLIIYYSYRGDEAWLLAQKEGLDYLMKKLESESVTVKLSEYFSDTNDLERLRLDDSKEKKYLEDFRKSLCVQVTVENWWLDIPALYLLFKSRNITVIVVNDYCSTIAILNKNENADSLAIISCVRQTSLTFGNVFINGRSIVSLSEKNFQTGLNEASNQLAHTAPRLIESFYIDRNCEKTSACYMKEEDKHEREVSIEPAEKRTATKVVTPKTSVKDEGKTVINPSSGRKVAIGSKTYLQLKKDGIL